MRTCPKLSLWSPVYWCVFTHTVTNWILGRGTKTCANTHCQIQLHETYFTCTHRKINKIQKIHMHKKKFYSQKAILVGKIKCTTAQFCFECLKIQFILESEFVNHFVWIVLSTWIRFHACEFGYACLHHIFCMNSVGDQFASISCTWLQCVRVCL